MNKYHGIPFIDLHGFDRNSAVLFVSDFIKDSLKMGNYKIYIIHGMGKGILKKEVHSFLSKNKSVKNFKVDFFNIGCTFVELYKS